MQHRRKGEWEFTKKKIENISTLCYTKKIKLGGSIGADRLQIVTFRKGVCAMTLSDFFTYSFAPYAGIGFLLIFMCANATVEKRIQKVFFLLAFLEFAEITFYNLELWTSTFSQPGIARMLFSAIGYTIRILSIYLFLLLSMREHATRKSQLLWGIPAMVNTIVAFSVFFSDVAFSFSPSNHFVRGPLGYTPHIIFLFYLVSIFLITIKGLYGRPLLESITIFAMVVFMVLSVLIATFFAVDVLGCVATVLSTIFYYMFFQTQVYRETMSEEQKSRAHFEEKSRTDDMTGLLNKSAFGEAAGRTISENADGGIALVFLDLDHFKQVNDGFGHLMGDKVIKDAAKKLQTVFRNADIIGRFGGDEFCVFMHSITKEVLQQRLDEILLSIRAKYKGEAQEFDVTASIGAVFCSHARNFDLQALLKAADAATYEAKSKGRNLFVIKEMNSQDSTSELRLDGTIESKV